MLVFVLVMMFIMMMVIFMFVMMTMLVFVIVMMFVFFLSILKVLNPSGTFKNGVKIKTSCRKYVVNIYVSLTCLYHLYVRLKSVHNRPDLFHLVFRNKILLVYYERRTEFYLLNQK